VEKTQVNPIDVKGLKARSEAKEGSWFSWIHYTRRSEAYTLKGTRIHDDTDQPDTGINVGGGQPLTKWQLSASQRANCNTLMMVGVIDISERGVSYLSGN
jgi:hypothetical protein